MGLFGLLPSSLEVSTETEVIRQTISRLTGIILSVRCMVYHVHLTVTTETVGCSAIKTIVSDSVAHTFDVVTRNAVIMAPSTNNKVCE